MYREARDRRRHSRRHKGACSIDKLISYQGGCRRRGRRCQAGQEEQERLTHSHTQTNTQTHTQTPRRKSVNIKFKYLMQLLGLV